MNEIEQLAYIVSYEFLRQEKDRKLFTQFIFICN
jgi:hypothetical protein